jgi:DNA-binding CsgD family transcriptional regulator
MAASRLSDAQKQELVRRWRAGESSAALADGFGCSPNTVTRVVKGALPPELYDQL